SNAISSNNSTVVTVNAIPIIGTQPTAQTTCSTPGTASFTIPATDTALTYQWRLNGVNLVDNGTTIIGATTSTLSLSGLTSANTVLAGAGYDCVVTGTGPCPVTSTRVALTVN